MIDIERTFAAPKKIHRQTWAFKSEKIKKIYFRPSEVCSMLKVNHHRLHYWEKTFGFTVKKTANMRLYTRDIIAKLHMIKSLLDDQKFTVEGAKLQLKKIRV